MIVLIGLMIVLIVFSVRWYLKKLQVILNLNIPTVQEYLPIIGHGHKLIGLSAEELFTLLSRFSVNFPILSKAWVFNVLVVFVNDPTLIQKVLTSDVCLERPEFISKFMSLDNGLFHIRNERWKHDRTFFNSSFNTQMVKTFIPTFIQATNRMMIKIEAFNNKPFDVLKIAELCAIEMITATSFGLNIESPRNEVLFQRFLTAVKIGTESIPKRLRNPLLFSNTIFKMTPTFWKLRNAKNNVDKFQFPNNATFSCNRVASAAERLLQSDDIFTHQQMKEHRGTFIAGGYDTTAQTTANCLLLLAMHPNVQDKVVEEIFQLFPSDDDNFINLNSLNELKYLEQVIQETLRVAPTIPFFPREPSEDFEIKPGCVIPKGTVLVFNTFVLHRRKDIWGLDADKFNPDRFLPETIATIHPYAYIPFSVGKRNCIGLKYAKLSLKIILMKCLRTFKFHTNMDYDDITFKGEVTLRLSGQHLMHVEKRNFSSCSSL
ncbi:unnamed protein product [Diamesa serratosioi]